AARRAPSLSQSAPHCEARGSGGCAPWSAAVQALAQLLAGLEEGNVLLRHADGRPGARVAPHARLSPLHREGAETAQLDPVPPGQGFADFVEDGRDDALHVTVVKV